MRKNERFQVLKIYLFLMLQVRVRLYLNTNENTTMGEAEGAQQWDIKVKCKVIVHPQRIPFGASMVKMKLAQSAMIVFDS